MGKKDKRLLSEVKIQRYILRNKVNKFDPLGIGEGFPNDEYDDLVTRIISILNNNKNDNVVIKHLLIKEICSYSGLDENQVQRFVDSIQNWWNFYMEILEKGSDLFAYEKCLSEEILDKAIISGNEFGWRHEDINLLVEEFRKKDIAIEFGQFQYVLPDGTCDFYWLDIVLDKRELNQSWKEFSNQTCNEYLIKYQELYSKINFDEEIKSFNFLIDKAKEGINVHDFRCFIIYAITEDEYNKRNHEKYF